MTYSTDEIGAMRLVRGALPGEPVPYTVASGKGLSFETAGQLWTVIARGSDSGGAFDAAYIRGRRGAESPLARAARRAPHVRRDRRPRAGVARHRPRR
ncbi:MAG TPA: hypothetical protein VK015_08680, partial [Microbacterium sp.]|nr:hypothetical protein [Microbacterium sp.]